MLDKETLAFHILLELVIKKNLLATISIDSK
jgi:hypothetical protein